MPSPSTTADPDDSGPIGPLNLPPQDLADAWGLATAHFEPAIPSELVKDENMLRTLDDWIDEPICVSMRRRSGVDL